MDEKRTVIIGAAILDVLARPVDPSVFEIGSLPAETIALSTGGDAMNEACVLASLGGKTRLVSKLGKDPGAELILARCRTLGIDTEYIVRTPEIPTSVNVVLVDEKGERHFITSPEGTLRKLYPEDVREEALTGGDILSFASIFVAPGFDDQSMFRLFSEAKKRGMTVCADMTKRKKGETLEDLRDCLSCVDFIFPNYAEASLLTGLQDWEEIGDAFLKCGVKHVILKAGAKGCFVKTPEEHFWSPACPGVRCVDTTGAGDTFTGCFLFALSRGYSLRECAAFANAGASLCVEQVGAPGNGLRLEEVLGRMRK